MAEGLKKTITETSELPFLRRKIKRFEQSVLDVACGSGRLLMPLLKSGPAVEGADVSADMLAHCRRLAFGATPPRGPRRQSKPSLFPHRLSRPTSTELHTRGAARKWTGNTYIEAETYSLTGQMYLQPEVVHMPKEAGSFIRSSCTAATLTNLRPANTKKWSSLSSNDIACDPPPNAMQASLTPWADVSPLSAP